MVIRRIVLFVENAVLVWIVRASALAMVVLVVGNVVARKVFSESFTWSNELVVDLLMPILVFLGASRAFRDGAFLRMTSLSSRLPSGVKRWLDISFDIVGVAVWGLIAWRSLEAAVDALDATARIGVFAIPSWLSFGIVGVGCLFLALEMTAHVVLSIVGRETEDDDEVESLEGAI